MELTFLQLAIVVLLVYLGVYALIDRILRCIEHCAEVKNGYFEVIEEDEVTK